VDRTARAWHRHTGTAIRTGVGVGRARGSDLRPLKSDRLYAYGRDGPFHSTGRARLVSVWEPCRRGPRPGPRRGGRPVHLSTGRARKIDRLRSPRSAPPRPRGVMVSVPSQAERQFALCSMTQTARGGRDVHALLGFAPTRRAVLSRHLSPAARSFSAGDSQHNR